MSCLKKLEKLWLKLVQLQQIHNDHQGKEGGTLFLNSHLLKCLFSEDGGPSPAVVVSSSYSYVSLISMV